MTAITYTAPEVLEESVRVRLGGRSGWADPENDPRDVADWGARQQRALIPFELDWTGRPVNPVESTPVLEGRNELGRWGENAAADPVVIATRVVPYLLMVRRKDRKQWAFPGGMIEPGETVIEAALRELSEETGLDVNPALARPLAPRYVHDPRACRRAWITTGPVLVNLGRIDALPAVDGGDDAEAAAWIEAFNVYHVAAILERLHGGEIYPPHVEFIAEFIGEHSARF